jgi:hypothetical protein
MFEFRVTKKSYTARDLIEIEGRNLAATFRVMARSLIMYKGSPVKPEDSHELILNLDGEELDVAIQTFNRAFADFRNTLAPPPNSGG